MLQLSELLTLAARIRQHQRGAAEDFGVEFLLAGRIRADGGDVSSRLKVRRPAAAGGARPSW